MNFLQLSYARGGTMIREPAGICSRDLASRRSHLNSATQAHVGGTLHNITPADDPAAGSQ
jgi:hypothetical protein